MALTLSQATMDLLSGEPLDNDHGSRTERTRTHAAARGRPMDDGPLVSFTNQVAAEREQMCSSSIGEESEVADANEPAW